MCPLRARDNRFKSYRVASRSALACVRARVCVHILCARYALVRTHARAFVHNVIRVRVCRGCERACVGGKETTPTSVRAALARVCARVDRINIAVAVRPRRRPPPRTGFKAKTRLRSVYVLWRLRARARPEDDGRRASGGGARE